MKEKKKKKGPALYELATDKEVILPTNPPASGNVLLPPSFRLPPPPLMMCLCLGKRKREKQSLEERLKSLSTVVKEQVKRNTEGAMQMTFVPKSSKKKHKQGPQQEEGGDGRRQRRSARHL